MARDVDHHDRGNPALRKLPGYDRDDLTCPVVATPGIKRAAIERVGTAESEHEHRSEDSSGTRDHESSGAHVRPQSASLNVTRGAKWPLHATDIAARGEPPTSRASIDAKPERAVWTGPHPPDDPAPPSGSASIGHAQSKIGRGADGVPVAGREDDIAGSVDHLGLRI